jgi:hypothetical protein
MVVGIATPSNTQALGVWETTASDEGGPIPAHLVYIICRLILILSVIEALLASILSSFTHPFCKGRFDPAREMLLNLYSTIRRLTLDPSPGRFNYKQINS